MKKENIYRYVGETKTPLQIENEDGTFTIIKLIHGLILTKEVVDVASGSGMISPLVDEKIFQEYGIQAQVVED